MTAVLVRNESPARKSDGIRYVPIDVTPERAALWLASNDGNRKVKPLHVDSLADAMIRGEFRFNGDTIRISRSGRLLDGQHRLAAIVQTGLTVELLVVFNLPDDVADTIDQGIHRSVEDILKMRGYSVVNATTVKAAAAILINYSTAESTRTAAAANRIVVADYVQEHLGELNTWAAWAKPVSAKSPIVSGSTLQRSRGMSAGPLTALATYMVRAGADSWSVRSFLLGAALGFNIPSVDMAKLTPQRLSNLQAVHRRMLNGDQLKDTSGNRAALMTEYATYITAYNRFILNEDVRLARAPRGIGRHFGCLPRVISTGLAPEEQLTEEVL